MHGVMSLPLQLKIFYHAGFQAAVNNQIEKQHDNYVDTECLDFPEENLQSFVEDYVALWTSEEPSD